MRFGMAVPHFGPLARPGAVEEISRSAEVLGYDSIWASDHVIVPPGEGHIPHFFYDIFVAMTMMTAVTERVTVGASVLVLPYRDPRPTAKAIATIDQVSGGRVVLGVGVGSFQPEFAALGVDHRLRGALSDEYLDCMRALWTEDPVTFNGRFVRFEGMRQNPKPTQRPLPVWVGGTSDAALRRAARKGEGWHAIGLDVEQFSDRVRAYHEACAGAGREPGVVSMRFPDRWADHPAEELDPAAAAEELRAYSAAGLHEVIFAPPVRNLDQYTAAMRYLARSVIPLV